MARIYSNELLANRTVEEELKKMETVNPRLTYWYIKEWAYFMKKASKKCKAVATFVNGYDFKPDWRLR